MCKSRGRSSAGGHIKQKLIFKKNLKNAKKYVSNDLIKMALKLDSGTILGLFFTYTTSWDTGKHFLTNLEKVNKCNCCSTLFEHFRTELIFGLLGHKTSLLGKAIF